MSVLKSKTSQQNIIDEAVLALNNGGVIAYPTEYCFGLGCDPQNQSAIQRLLDIKRRNSDQGLILVASSILQVKQYAHLENSPMLHEIKNSWPGHVSWLLAVKSETSKLLCGKHTTVACRISRHPIVNQLCDTYAGAIVSTSANRHGKAVLKSAKEVTEVFGSELDYILDAPIGNESKASKIRDGSSGAVIR